MSVSCSCAQTTHHNIGALKYECTESFRPLNVPSIIPVNASAGKCVCMLSYSMLHVLRLLWACTPWSSALSYMSGLVAVGVQSPCSCCYEQTYEADKALFFSFRQQIWAKLSRCSLSNRNLLDHKSKMWVCWCLLKYCSVRTHCENGRLPKPVSACPGPDSDITCEVCECVFVCGCLCVCLGVCVLVSHEQLVGQCVGVLDTSKI